MAYFEMDVIETRTVKVRDVVQAEDISEAMDFAVIGDTYSEEEFSSSTEVINRIVYSAPIQIADPE